MITLNQDVVVLDWQNQPEAGVQTNRVAGKGVLFLNCKNDNPQTNQYYAYLNWDNKQDAVCSDVFRLLGWNKRQSTGKEANSLEESAPGVLHHLRTEGVATGASAPIKIQFPALKVDSAGRPDADQKPGFDVGLRAGKYRFEIIVGASEGDAALGLEPIKGKLPADYKELTDLIKARSPRIKVFPATLVIPPAGNWHFTVKPLDQRDKKNAPKKTGIASQTGIAGPMVNFKWKFRRAAKMELQIVNERNDWFYGYLDVTKAQAGGICIDPRMQFTPPLATAISEDAEPEVPKQEGLPWPVVAVPPASPSKPNKPGGPGKLSVPLLLYPGKRSREATEIGLADKISIVPIEAPVNGMKGGDTLVGNTVGGNPKDVDAAVWARNTNRPEPPKSYAKTALPSVFYHPLIGSYQSPTKTLGGLLKNGAIWGGALVIAALAYYNIVYRGLIVEPVELTTTGKIKLLGKFVDGAKVHVWSNDNNSNASEDLIARKTLEGQEASDKYKKRLMKNVAQDLVSGDNPIPPAEVQEGVIELDADRYLINGKNEAQVNITVGRHMPFLGFILDHLLPNWPCKKTVKIVKPETKKEAETAAVARADNSDAKKPKRGDVSTSGDGSLTGQDGGKTDSTGPIRRKKGAEDEPKHVNGSDKRDDKTGKDKSTTKGDEGTSTNTNADVLTSNQQLTKSWFERMGLPKKEFEAGQEGYKKGNPLGLTLTVSFPNPKLPKYAKIEFTANKACYIQLYGFVGDRRALLGVGAEGRCFDPKMLKSMDNTAKEMAILSTEDTTQTTKVDDPATLEYIAIAVDAAKVPAVDASKNPPDTSARDEFLGNLLLHFMETGTSAGDWAVVGYSAAPNKAN